MINDGSVPLAGFLRVVYLVGLAVVLTVFVISAVTNIYEGPSEGVPSEFRSLVTDEDQGNYNRNLGGIFSLLGIAVAATGVLALRREQNGLRTGLLLGGLIVLFAGLLYAGGGSDDWLVAVWSLLAAAVLLAIGPFLEEGGLIDWRRLRSMRSPPPRPPAA